MSDTLASIERGATALDNLIAKPNPASEIAALGNANAAGAKSLQHTQDDRSGVPASDKGDLGDSPHQQPFSGGRRLGDSGRLSEAEKAQALKFAQAKLLTNEFQPPDYPVAALGGLADACIAIAEGGQMQPAMAGQSLLAAASLLAQSRANVRTLAGIKPLSLFVLTVADSGDGKTTAEDVALDPIHTWQRAAMERYRTELEAAELPAERRKRGEPKPNIPREPYIVMRDGTIEGIRRAFRQGLPSQGVFSSEAAMMLSGYGMNAENRAKSAGNFNSLWDTGEVSVARGLDGRIQLYDRRLSLHWLIQPEVARSAMHDPLLTLIGFWPRFLVAWPESSIPRKVRLFRPELDGRISAYWQRCHELLAAPLGDDCRNLQLIEATDRAQALLGTFFERMETAKMASSILTSIRPFALRATEMTFRIAGVLAVFEGKSLIDPDAASRAITLATYSIETWRNIFGNRDEADARALALGLFGWLLKQDGCQVREASILHIGLPKRIRSKDRRDSALALLEQHRLVERERDVWFVRRPEKC